MKNFISRALFLAILTLPFLGCGVMLPITSNLNNLVVFSIKPNSIEKIDFTYSSVIKDGIVGAYNKDKSGFAGGMGYDHFEASVMQKMISDYMHFKFQNILKGSDTKINISFEEFYIEQYKEETALFSSVGANAGWILTANVKINITIIRNGQEYTKSISATSDDKYTTGIFSKNSDSPEGTHGNNINNANNKAIMLLNTYLQENGL